MNAANKTSEKLHAKSSNNTQFVTRIDKRE
jgi:hypothetical protein